MTRTAAPPRITHVVRQFWPQHGGLEESVHQLCRTLRIELSSLFRPFDRVGVEAGFAETEQTPFIVEAFADKDVVTLVRTFQGIKDKRVRRKILDLVATIADEPAADDAPSPTGKRR